MNHRERVLATLAHREPDRVPRYASLNEEVVAEFQRRTGHASPDEYWGWDFRGVGFRPPDPLPDLKARFARYFQGREGSWVLDWEHRVLPPEWGVATREAHFHDLVAPVAPMLGLSRVEELADYPFPDYIQEWRHDHLEAEVQRLKDEGYPVTASLGWIFQTAWTLRSETLLFADFYENPDFAAALLDRITAIRVAQATRLAQAGVDIVTINDDIGSQRGMILSPAMWRQWLKPRLAQVIAAVHRVNPNIYFRYHSDGNYLAVIPELIEIGVSSLITVQPEAMDVFEIKSRFGAQLTLDGTIGLQSELMFGTPEQVRAKIKQQCAGLMPGGGWIASPGNGVTPDVPWENLAAMFDALDEFGRYGR
jgi:uroporphyrinogen decarboxylase